MKVGKAVLLCAAAGANGLSLQQRRYLYGRDLAVNVTSEASLSISTLGSTPPSTPPSIPTPFSRARSSLSSSFPPSLQSSLTTSTLTAAHDDDSTTTHAPTSCGHGRGTSFSSCLYDTYKHSSIQNTSSAHNNTTTTTLSSHPTRNPTPAPYPYPTGETNVTNLPGTGRFTTICPTDGGKCYVAGTTIKTITALPTTTVIKPCIPITNDWQPVTVFHIVHTATVTFFGNRSHYTPRYPVIETPRFCFPSITHPDTAPTETGSNSNSWKLIYTVGTGHLPSPTQIQLGMPPPVLPRPTITFITTDKNPAVVFPFDTPPASSQGPNDPYPDPVIHKSVAAAGTIRTGTETTTPDADVQQRRPTFHIVARGNQVIINRETFWPGPGVTAVVRVDGGLFTIYPDAVVGEGGIITKPPPAPTELSVPTPECGVVGGLNVSLSGSELVIGGVAMKIPLYPTTTMISGQRVIISPNVITVGTSVFRFNLTQPPPESEVVVDGGEMLTAIGKTVVVLHQTTITYGPGIPPLTEVVDDDTITIGPAGVVVHGMTLGGPSAGANETRLEIVGGATITRIAPSILVINGHVFTLGPDVRLTTTEIGGELFTIGPFGVAVSTLNMTLPFGPSVVGDIVPTGTWLSHFPKETDPNTDDKDSSSPTFRWSMSRSGFTVCIAIGVLVFG
ncbi:hypothetical protein E4U55_007295 [Claviceps digitariae]|nr:hypothetical protein E4U55_007295 [Claviceps digitariae]